MSSWREIVMLAASELKPHAEYIACLGQGNHETSVLLHSHVQLCHDLSDELAQQTGHKIPVMGYQWFWNLGLTRSTGSSSTAGVQGYCHHGYGGAARRTKGIMHFTDLAEQVFADVYVMGHTHTMTIHPGKRKYLVTTPKGLMEKTRQVLNLRTGSYKSFGDWEIEKNFEGPNMGGIMLNCEVERRVMKNVESTHVNMTAELWAE
jgi:hypothetical protein